MKRITLHITEEDRQVLSTLVVFGREQFARMERTCDLLDMDQFSAKYYKRKLACDRLGRLLSLIGAES